HETKAVLLPPLLKFLGDLDYSEAGIAEDGLISFSIMPDHDDYRSEDHIKGAFDSVNFDLSRIALASGSGKKKHVVFKGVVSILEMNKPFKGKTILLSNSSLLGRLHANPVPGLEA